MNASETTTPQTGTVNEVATPAGQTEPRPSAASSPAAPLLMGVKLPIRVLLGRTLLSLRDVAQLDSGSVVELDCSPNDPVEIMVNDRVIAHGEVVVVAGNYGVRITGIPAPAKNSEPAVPANDLLNLSEKLK